jgi:hypothetical protein
VSYSEAAGNAEVSYLLWTWMKTSCFWMKVPLMDKKCHFIDENVWSGMKRKPFWVKIVLMEERRQFIHQNTQTPAEIESEDHMKASQ